MNTNRTILEVSLVDEHQQFKVYGLQWEDPAAWGLLLADIARFVASTYEAEKGIEKKWALQRMMQGLDLEMSNPTE